MLIHSSKGIFTVDGGWAEWSGDDTCSVTCGRGQITRLRRCDSPVPQHGGEFCAGRDEKTEPCQVDVKCPS